MLTGSGSVSYPDENENLSVSDPIFSFSDSDHWELGWTLAITHQLTDLERTDNENLVFLVLFFLSS